MSQIKSLSVGNGDMYYINHNSDNFTIIDSCYESDESFNEDIEEIKKLASKKGVVRFISTHPDEDHIRGIKKLFESIDIPNFYVVENEAMKKDKSDSFNYYCDLRNGTKTFFVYKNCSRKWMNKEDDERKSSGINFKWPDTGNSEFKDVLEKVKKGEQLNNISPIFTYSLANGVTAMWMGDIESDFLEKVKENIEWPNVDILFAPHHGRDSGKPSEEILKKIKPKLVVIGEANSENLNYYAGYHTITQNSAKDILFECGTKFVDIYVGSETYRTTENFLVNKKKSDMNGMSYLGTLEL